MSKSNADTSHLSHDEIKQHNLHSSKRPPGTSGGGVLHQTGGSGIAHTGRYPLLLAGVTAVVGLAGFFYYRSVHPDPKGQAGSHSRSAQSSAQKGDGDVVKAAKAT